VVTLYANTRQIREEAAQLDPVKVLITLVLIVPFLLGFTARFVWVALALCWTGVFHGWRTATDTLNSRKEPPR